MPILSFSFKTGKESALAPPRPRRSTQDARYGLGIGTDLSVARCGSRYRANGPFPIHHGS